MAINVATEAAPDKLGDAFELPVQELPVATVHVTSGTGRSEVSISGVQFPAEEGEDGPASINRFSATLNGKRVVEAAVRESDEAAEVAIGELNSTLPQKTILRALGAMINLSGVESAVIDEGASKVKTEELVKIAGRDRADRLRVLAVSGARLALR